MGLVLLLLCGDAPFTTLGEGGFGVGVGGVDGSAGTIPIINNLVLCVLSSSSFMIATTFADFTLGSDLPWLMYACSREIVGALAIGVEGGRSSSMAMISSCQSLLQTQLLQSNHFQTNLSQRLPRKATISWGRGGQLVPQGASHKEGDAWS